MTMERRLNQKVSKSYQKSYQKSFQKVSEKYLSSIPWKKVPKTVWIQYLKTGVCSIKTQELLTRNFSPGVSPALSPALSLAVSLHYLWHYQSAIATLSPKLPMIIFKHTKSYPRRVWKSVNMASPTFILQMEGAVMRRLFLHVIYSNSRNYWKFHDMVFVMLLGWCRR